MSTIPTPRYTLYPGETLVRTEDGNLLLTMRNGNTQEFTDADWAEYVGEHQMSVSEMLECLIYEYHSSGRTEIGINEVTDRFMELLTRVQQIETALQRSAALLLKRPIFDTPEYYESEGDDDE